MSRKRKPVFHVDDVSVEEHAACFACLNRRSRLDALRSARMSVREYATSAQEVTNWCAVIDRMITEEYDRMGRAA